MVAHALTRIAALLALTWLAACASGPDLPRAVTIEAGQPTRVTLRLADSKRTFLLQNASSTTAADFYDGDMSDLAKIAPDEQVQMLLDILAAKGMFTARAGGGDATDAMAVEHGGRRWIWSRPRGGAAEDLIAFQEARACFLEVWNQSQAYHPARSLDRADLEAERDRLRREAEARTRAGRPPGEKP